MPPKRKVDSTPRFSESEKTFLEEIVNDFPAIRSKETNKFGLEKKHEAWERVTELFNAEPSHTQRTCSQLKKCWDNLKQRKKERLTAIKAQRLQTGGGPSVPIPDYSPMEDEFGGDINIELRGTIDSDTVQEIVAGSNDFYTVSHDGVLITAYDEEEGENPDDPPPGPSATVMPSTQSTSDVVGTGDELLELPSNIRQSVSRPSTSHSMSRRSTESRASNYSVSGTPYTTGRKKGIAMEQKLREEKFRTQEKREMELHKLRKEELEIRKEIAEIERETVKEEAKERIKRVKFETERAEFVCMIAEHEFRAVDEKRE